MNSSIEDATPMVTNFYLNTDEGGKPVDQTTYRGMIGSHYLITSRPNIMSFVCVCARFQANPKEQHLIAIKRILKYLKGNYVVQFLISSKRISLPNEFSNSNFSSYRIDR